MKKVAPVPTTHLFAGLRTRLLDLLKGLSVDDWTRPTAAPLWTVKDIALHLWGGDVGVLSRNRDGFAAGSESTLTQPELVRLINDLNHVWVKATRRISTQLLCDLLLHTGPQVDEYFLSLDLFAMGHAVSWVGPEPAPVWLDVAREFTERWHHQQQIRDATGRQALYEPALFAPVLATFVHALPHSLNGLAARDAGTVKLIVTGEATGLWLVRREPGGWELFTGEADDTADAVVELDADTAWRLFTKGLRPDEARGRAKVSGNPALTSRVLETIAIIG